MALTRQETALTYQSGGGGVFYSFEVAQDPLGNLTVRNIITPTGRVTDSMTGLPSSVVEDIQTAMAQLEDLVAQTSALGGQLTYTDETVQSVSFGVAFSSTSYRVHVEVPDFISWKIVNKTTTGFDVELSASFTGVVGFDVFV